MRTLILPLLLAATPAVAAGPAKFTVVVHTTDRVVAKYLCDQDETRPTMVFRTELRRSGQFLWHVVGGTAPYTVLKDELTVGNTRCITVMDADGQVATACGIMGTQEILIRQACSELPSGELWSGLVPDSLSDTQRAPMKKKANGWLPPGTGGTAAGPESYIPPVKQATDTPTPPRTKPGPERVKTVQRTGPTTRTTPPPTTRPSPGLAPNRVQPSGTVSYGSGGQAGHTPARQPGSGPGTQSPLQK